MLIELNTDWTSYVTRRYDITVTWTRTVWRFRVRVTQKWRPRKSPPPISGEGSVWVLEWRSAGIGDGAKIGNVDVFTEIHCIKMILLLRNFNLLLLYERNWSRRGLVYIKKCIFNNYYIFFRKYQNNFLFTFLRRIPSNFAKPVV